MDEEIYNNYLVLANKAYEKQRKEDNLVSKIKQVFKDNPSKYDEIMSLLDSVGRKER